MWILLGILAVPLIEIALFVQIGSHIGVIGTLAWIITTAILGLLLMRLEPQRNAHDLRAALAAERDPTSPMAHSALRLIGAVLILLPGFLTDLLGALTLIPALRNAILAQALAKLRAGSTGRARSETIIIEGEYEHTPESGANSTTRLNRPGDSENQNRD